MKKRVQQSTHRRVRVADVAALAGCSTATVSRALNDSPTVDGGLVERVRAAAAKLGYTPNNAARALRSRRTRMLGTVIPTLDHAIYAKQVNGLQRRLADAGYSLIVTTSDYDLEREFEETRMLVERGAEGVVLVGDLHAPKLYEFLESSGIPYVNTYVYHADSPHPCVGFDNKQSARQGLEFLLMLGHRKFAVLGGIARDNDRAAERIAAIREALGERGIELSEDAVLESAYTIDAGRAGMRMLLRRRPRPTAVVCGSDILAFGALAECTGAGLQVPQDLSIVGFDDLDFAAHLAPPLTTIEVPAADMGRGAAEYLVARLDGYSTRDHCELETRLIVRGTTAAPPERVAAKREQIPAALR